MAEIPRMLGQSEVHLWLTTPERVIASGMLGSYDALVTPDERARQQRFHFEKDRRDGLITRALVRTTLSRYAPVPPAAWVFGQNRHGRPQLMPGQCDRDLRFSLSHTQGLIACAVTLDREIGVDVEYMPRPRSVVEVAERYFSASEVRALRAIPPERQQERFFQYWTLKESYIKARGMGLALPLEQFSFELDAPSPIGIVFDLRLADDPRRWQFELMRPTPDHMMALGVDRGPGATLAVRVAWTVPLID
jgi:4'-phosphopantetheinyl transferase